MNNLPEEILDIIWTHYWQFKYNDVINEINYPLEIEEKHISFIKKNFGVIACPYRDNYKHHLEKMNNSICKIINNEGLFLICKQNRLLMRFITNDYLKHVFKDVPDNYKHIASLFVILSGSNRFKVLFAFENINKPCKINISDYAAII